MIVGYARTSTVEQVAGFEAQLQTLKEAGCDKLFQEQVSSVGKRAQLEAALEFVREGDVLVVTKLDRLARSVADLLGITEQLERKKVGLRILNLGMDTHTPTGKLMLTLLGGVAQFEREMMLERQREGIARCPHGQALADPHAVVHCGRAATAVRFAQDPQRPARALQRISGQRVGAD